MSTESNTPNRANDSQDERLTLSQAARITPGAPMPNAIWRWCRKGVKARTGERVRLEHVRVGGKLFTTRRWLDEFSRRLAEADAAYFERSDRGGRRWRQVSARDGDAKRREIEAALKAEGL